MDTSYVVGTDASISILPAPVPPRGRGNMTLRRLAPLLLRAKDDKATEADIDRATRAISQRVLERGKSKLARRLTRKAALGMSGSF